MILKKGRYGCAVCLILALAAVFAGCSGRIKAGPGWEGERVTAEGMSAYNEKDIPASKAAALAAAQRHAVEQVVGVFVSGRTQVQHAIAIQQRVMSRTQGFIKSYEILREGKEGDYWKTTIRAVVLVQDIGTLIDELKIVDRARGNTKILVLINEAMDNGRTTGNEAAGGVYRAQTE